MIVGVEKLTERVDKILANIEESSELSELIEIDEVMVIAVVHYSSNPIEESETGALFYTSSSARFHVQHGLLSQAMFAVRDNQKKVE